MLIFICAIIFDQRSEHAMGMLALPSASVPFFFYLIFCCFCFDKKEAIIFRKLHIAKFFICIS
ncbi:hypothetical protein XarbCFBP7614_02045 [Xanthomonas arboricola]|nr:hypothetical protein XarbCFBP7614_02045 [Xanthomonas arboricola]